MGEIVSTPAPRRRSGKAARRRRQRVGVLELNRLPGGIAHPLLAAGLPAVALLDATAMYRAARHPADATEIAVSRKAATLGAATASTARIENADFAARPAALTAAIEGPARLAGAEEVIVEFAPDLGDNTALRRIDGDLDAGRRATRCGSPSPARGTGSGSAGLTAPSGSMTGSRAACRPFSMAKPSPGWARPIVTLEACIGSAPLTAVHRHCRPVPSARPTWHALGSAARHASGQCPGPRRRRDRFAPDLEDCARSGLRSVAVRSCRSAEAAAPRRRILVLRRVGR